ncbi:MAG: trehalose-6-phosphate synthase [Chloroflexota bacterium]|nr:MAG: trehalose-6-phosphate synthase [Chloroflexota bacterium]
MPGTLAEAATRTGETTCFPIRSLSARELDRPLIVLSNRGPLEHHLDETGTLRAVRGQGGVITALSAVAERARVHWIAAAITETDHRIASGELSRPHRSPQEKLSLQLVSLKPEVYDNYYNRFSNSFLWFLQHGIEHSKPRTTALEYAWRAGYVPANQAMARATLRAACRLETSPVVMLHDYHLYLVARYLRPLLPHAVIQHFVHIPWPGPDTWDQLAAGTRASILASLLANDIVGLHTRRDVRNFLDTAQALVPGAVVDRAASAIRYDGRTTRVHAYPISVDVPKLRREVTSAEVRSYAKNLASVQGERTIVRVDRLDPSKNIVRGFEAFDLLLQRRPELRGKVRFLCFLVPSRTSISVYRQYEHQTLEAARSLNRRYGTSGWSPVQVFHENNYYQALAAMQLYDVLLVNPVADGMNLVSKEGPIVNERDGVLVLSRTAGSYEQLAEGALGVNPRDVMQTLRTLEAALDMPCAERQRRANLLKCAVEQEDLSFWLDSQLADIDEILRLRPESRP